MNKVLKEVGIPRAILLKWEVPSVLGVQPVWLERSRR